MSRVVSHGAPEFSGAFFRGAYFSWEQSADAVASAKGGGSTASTSGAALSGHVLNYAHDLSECNGDISRVVTVPQSDPR